MKGIERWSHPTWDLFHTLAEKVKPEMFPKTKNKLFWIFRNICSTLPCPECREHAVSFVKLIKFKNIKTKAHFKQVLLIFHNEVNNRLNKPKFTNEQLTKTYSEKKLRQVIGTFIKEYANVNTGNRDMANSMARNIILRNMNGWFKKNIQHFN